MRIAYLPRISEQNYESFRSIIQDAPAAFNEWQHHLARKALDLSVKGWRVESVELDPDEFKRDCDLTQSPHNLHSLDNFVFKVAQRKKD
jgi:hypothetical protein